MNFVRNFLPSIAIVVAMLHATSSFAGEKACIQIGPSKNWKVGLKCRTQTGAVFERVRCKLSKACWKVSDGRIWADTSKLEYENKDLDGTKPINGVIQKSAATEACKSVGGILPSKDDLLAFILYFKNNGYAYVNDGENEKNVLFPRLQRLNDFEGDQVWSSTIDEPTGNAFFLSEIQGPHGRIDDGFRANTFRVRCLAH
jgi:hypothetical protein